jgi:SAM-dependent methyltransferase
MESTVMGSVVGAFHDRLVTPRRTRIIADILREYLPYGASVLDVGCGDGTLDLLIQAARPDLSLTGIDVLIWPNTAIPVSAFDGRTLPVEDKSVDIVMFVDVLHHANDPMILLSEAKRAARKVILVKDHTMDGPFAYATLRFMDWVGNAHHNVALPYNYWPEARWRDAFGTLHLMIDRWESTVRLYRLHFIAQLDVS